MPPIVMIIASAGVAVLGLIGHWAEVFMTWRFIPWYFRWGPVIRRHAGPLSESASTPFAALPARFAWRECSESEWLVRRQLTIGRLVLDIPVSWWTYRLRVVNGGRPASLRLECRHHVCWPLFLLSPLLTLPVVMSGAIDWASWCEWLGFFSLPVALTAVLLFFSVRAARSDADAVWSILKGSSSGNGDSHLL
jgi:hypothetical protein